MKNVCKAKLIAVLAMAINIAIYLTRPGGESYVFITDFMAVVLALSASVVGYYSFKRYGLRSIHGKALFLILFGISLWFIAELFWLLFGRIVYYYVEFLRLIGYVPLTAGFFYALLTTSSSLRERKGELLAVFGLFMAFSVIYLNIIPILFGQLTVIHSILVNGYLVMDFALLFGIGLLAWATFSFRGGYLSKAWMLFTLGFVSIFLFDLVFALTYPIYRHGSLIELLWLAGYILIALGFYYHMHAIGKLKKGIKKLKKKKK